MPEFKNIRGADVHLDSPNGPGFTVKPDETFTGSSYYNKYTADGASRKEVIYLELVGGTLDDYALPQNVESYDGVNLFRSYSLTATGDITANILDFITDLGEEATYLRIEGTCTMRLNGDSGSDFAITGPFEFPTNKVSIASLAVSGSGTVNVLAGTSRK